MKKIQKRHKISADFYFYSAITHPVFIIHEDCRF